MSPSGFEIHLPQLSVLHGQCLVLVVEPVMAFIAKSDLQPVLLAVFSVFAENNVMCLRASSLALDADIFIKGHDAFHSATLSGITKQPRSSPGLSLVDSITQFFNIVFFFRGVHPACA